jgi:hypothetical protein
MVTCDEKPDSYWRNQQKDPRYHFQATYRYAGHPEWGEVTYAKQFPRWLDEAQLCRERHVTRIAGLRAAQRMFTDRALAEAHRPRQAQP